MLRVTPIEVCLDLVAPFELFFLSQVLPNHSCKDLVTMVMFALFSKIGPTYPTGPVARPFVHAIGLLHSKKPQRARRNVYNDKMVRDNFWMQSRFGKNYIQ